MFEPLSWADPESWTSALPPSSACVAQQSQLSLCAEDNSGPTKGLFNAFSLFGLPTVFNVCLSTLDQRYEEIQALIHPDQWISETAKQLAAQNSVRCNQAYTLLKHPETRAAHILQLDGHWPIPDFPDLFEILLDWYEHGHHPEAPDLNGACQTFSDALFKGNIDAAQRAYWWIKVTSNHKKQ
jgi:hypothetical protein